MSLYKLRRALHLPQTVYRRRRRPIAEDHIRAMFELNYYQDSLYGFTAATMQNPDILADFDLSADSVVLDVGAFVGAWSEKMSDRFGCTIYAFEPNPGVVGSLERRLAEREGVHIEPVGLGAADQTARLSVHGPGSSIYDTDAEETCEVTIRDVVAVFDELDLDRIDLLKLNIEGAEYDLLDRLVDARWLPRIDRLLVQFHEWHPKAYNRRRRLRRALEQQHKEVWGYPWVWEYWRRAALPSCSGGPANAPPPADSPPQDAIG